MVRDSKIEVQWEYEYHEDTDEIPTEEELQEYGRHYNPPEYFFMIRFEDVEYGEGQQSGLLTFKDYVDIELTNGMGEPVADAEYVLTYADGTERRGNLDAEGRARVDDVPPGGYTVMFPDPG